MNAQFFTTDKKPFLEEDKESVSEVIIRIENEIFGSDNDVQTIQDATKILFQKIVCYHNYNCHKFIFEFWLVWLFVIWTGHKRPYNTKFGPP